VTKRKEPLGYINDYFENAANVLNLERRLQKTRTEKLSKEKEAEFLSEITTTYDKMVEDYYRFYEFGLKVVDKKTGLSDYDKFMNNPFDMYFGISLDAHKDAPRNPRGAVEWLRGRSIAVKNGWDLNELNGIAGLFPLALDIEIKAEIFEKQYPSLEAIEKKKKISENKINEAQKKIDNIDERLKTVTDEDERKRLESL
jgi:hypothetical protein